MRAKINIYIREKKINRTQQYQSHLREREREREREIQLAVFSRASLLFPPSVRAIRAGYSSLPRGKIGQSPRRFPRRFSSATRTNAGREGGGAGRGQGKSNRASATRLVSRAHGSAAKRFQRLLACVDTKLSVRRAVRTDTLGNFYFRKIPAG